MWSVEEHLADVLRAVRPLAPLELPLLDASGCVLAEDVTVPAPLPPFDNSSMDGYAVRTADVEGASEEFPATLTVIGDVAAGAGVLPTVGPGQAARIMTGAPVPPGAQAVVPVEWTDGGLGGGPADAMAPASTPHGAEVRVHRPATAGAHIRSRGSDAAAGTLALREGTVLGPPQLGLLAAVGRATATVTPRPRAVVLSTGSELAAPGQRLAPGQIHDSNSYMLTAAAQAAGAVAYRATAVADDAATLRAALEDQLARADLVITSGGVSVGAYDVVKEALDLESGVEFRRLAMQPGKPQGFGLIGGGRVPLFALPGNPVSSFVSFELFVRPALRAMAGHAPGTLHRPRVTARLAAEAPVRSPAGRRQFLRGTYLPPAPGAAPGSVRPVGGSGSHLIAALAQADALIEIPENVTEAAPGDELTVLLLG
ncbi:gephyrin-like molybdotransferase Glp [Streptomyces hoynatensis]|uniref:Molybdopterin molybdenumtransferase n=1 Tax=Streptomyces hoynatensis TaxID=1141874 RepID=A0A3A9Z0D3_9ACTN|nr:gephyrin-like molybdotransferase Glp [Streptomyces hoynatensis]RKN41620.1 molybdopterin molybdenumtransferase MoeA [Streptomyces hoynatensis]